MSDHAAGAEPAIATASQTVGPFFHFGLTTNAALGRVAPADVRGERILLRIRVLDGDDQPLSDAMIEVYQADAAGRYGQPGFDGFGRLATDEAGLCTFDTIRPGAVSTEAAAGPEASHINVCVFARGLLRHLHTRIYFDGDADLDRDPILLLVPADRRGTLIAVCEDGNLQPQVWDFVIRLQGDEETVFFDV
jgi:protocatechuate 3,4-dioxygenase alpha subunit